jgi:hypothetical protein
MLLSALRTLVASTTRLSASTSPHSCGHLSLTRLADGAVKQAELHWYEATGIGRRELKIKRYID